MLLSHPVRSWLLLQDLLPRARLEHPVYDLALCSEGLVHSQSAPASPSVAEGLVVVVLSQQQLGTHLLQLVLTGLQLSGLRCDQAGQLLDLSHILSLRLPTWDKQAACNTCTAQQCKEQPCLAGLQIAWPTTYVTKSAFNFTD